MNISPNDTEYDACIIGAGLSGLTAAHILTKAGQRVLLLEARDRVGGRGFTVSAHDGTSVDVGGQWVGPSQHRILELLVSLNIGTYKQHNDGAHLLDIHGKRRRFSGSIPKIGPAALLDLQRTIWKIERLANRLDTEQPHTEAFAKYDNLTVAGWIDQQVYSKQVRTLLTAAVHAVFAAEPEEISCLFFLQYVKSAGGLMPLIESENGAQDSRVIGGMGGVAEALAERVTALDGTLLTNTPVKKVFVKDDQVRVITAKNIYGVHRVIVAMSPREANRIEWSPALPLKRQRLMSEMPMGSVIKCVAIYDRPFWREAGLSGEMVCDQEPLGMSFDATPTLSDDSHPHGALVGFIMGDKARRWSEEPAMARKTAVLHQLSQYFGKAALEPIDFIEKDWCKDEWTQGCYTGLMPAGMLSQYGKTLRQPCQRIHWAGTETATEWMGYFDGAIQAGERAAAEVLEHFT